MGAIEETQLTYIKGLMSDMDKDKIKVVEEEFTKFLAFTEKDEEYGAIGTLILARWGIEQSMNN